MLAVSRGGPRRQVADASCPDLGRASLEAPGDLAPLRASRGDEVGATIGDDGLTRHPVHPQGPDDGISQVLRSPQLAQWCGRDDEVPITLVAQGALGQRRARWAGAD